MGLAAPMRKQWPAKPLVNDARPESFLCRLCDRREIARSIIGNYANSALPILLDGGCSFQEFSGMGLEAKSCLWIIDCPCELKGTASVRA